MRAFWVYAYHQDDGLNARGFPTKRAAVDWRNRVGCQVGQIVKVLLPVALEYTKPHRKWINDVRKANGRAPLTWKR